MTGDDRESTDARLGLNVRTLRERRGMSGEALAQAMRDRGHRWHQNTVVRVEAGTQGVKFAEARDLAEILATSLDRLTWASAEANAAEALYAAGGQVRRAAAEVSGAVFRLLADTDRAGIIAKGTAEGVSPRVAAALDDLHGSLAEATLEQAVAEGIARHGELAAEAEGGDG